MKTSEIIGTIVKIIFMVLGLAMERNSESRTRKAEALKMVVDGLKERDRSAITAGLDRLGRGLIIAIAVSLLLCGCTSVTLHPLMPDDIFAINKGSVINGTTVTKDGWYLSNFYLEEVARARVKK